MLKLKKLVAAMKKIAMAFATNQNLTQLGMTDTKTAYRLRQRGLRLNPDSDYENPRLKEIAIEMDVLIRCLEELDMELKRLNENER